MDYVQLVFLLGLIAVMVWVSLSGISTKAEASLENSREIQHEAYTFFQKQLAIQDSIDAHRVAFTSLHEKLNQLASTPDFDIYKVRDLAELRAEMVRQKAILLEKWPQDAYVGLKHDYEENVGIIIDLTEEFVESSPNYMRQIASDAKDVIKDANQVMHELEEVDDHYLRQILHAMGGSIQTSRKKTQELKSELSKAKYRTMQLLVFTMLVLLVTRLLFSFAVSNLSRLSRRAQEIAEESLATKGRFLATMSHEIRTPLNGVIGMTHLLMKTPMNKKQTEYVESIHMSGEHLLTVINDVLDFSKIEAGKLELKKENIEIRAVIEDVLNTLTAKAQEKDLELSYVVDPSVPLFIEGDNVRLRQVFTNLVGNAIKFTEAGGITLHTKDISTDGESLELEFQVKDSGMGIPADRIESIFEQYSQADNSLSRNHEGTGLGLSISRNLVELMGGRIWAESEVNRGSAFHFTIQSRKTKGEMKPFLQPDIPEIIGKRLLIVGNNAVCNQTLHDACEGWGAKVTLSNSPAQVVGWVNSGKHFDFTLIDNRLDNASVIDFGRQLRQTLDGEAMSLIMIASQNHGYPKEVTREIFNRIIYNPVTRSRLFDALMTELGKKSYQPVIRAESDSKLGERLPLSVLLVEDNMVNQVVASTLLDEMGYKIDLAEDGKQAVDALNKKHYDLVFMDMQMPVMDGVTATKTIRQQLPAERQPVIIAMTANAMEGDRERCLNAGMDDYISKPIVPAIVEEKLLKSFGPQQEPCQKRKEENYATID